MAIELLVILPIWFCMLYWFNQWFCIFIDPINAILLVFSMACMILYCRPCKCMLLYLMNCNPASCTIYTCAKLYWLLYSDWSTSHLIRALIPCHSHLLLLLNYVVLRALWKIDVYLISTLVNNKKSLLNVFTFAQNQKITYSSILHSRKVLMK